MGWEIELDTFEYAEIRKRKMMDAGTVAEAGYKALKRGKLIVVPGLEYKFGQLFARFAPTSLVMRVVRSQHEPA